MNFCSDQEAIDSTENVSIILMMTVLLVSVIFSISGLVVFIDFLLKTIAVFLNLKYHNF